MGPADIPQPIRTETHEERQAADAQSRLVADAAIPIPASKGTEKTMEGTNKVAAEIKDHGQIADMKLPAGWEEGKPGEYTGIGYKSFRQFHPADSPDTKLCLFYRGFPISEDGGKNFAELLQKPPHKLTDEERKAVGEALDDMKDPKDFEIRRAATGDLDGKRVLMVEGRFNGIQWDRQELFVDADGTGRYVQEIYYTAPKDQYQGKFQDATTALQSIKWK